MFYFLLRCCYCGPLRYRIAFYNMCSSGPD
ncbi:unnamed protein product [Acanthoscelides obtectus]|uniref:Uncharacterized protein n=1 Tax=Acanthoscelides obtectus TaxID=200917 RepID=A0A9P0LUM5_ACAOB|nr:unnamed protein product [Acanthoscelides obtectus]CAK1652122.1 hypothetical protein AOBTE_LOCUS17697 [Acanthoscelides obtectus]